MSVVVDGTNGLVFNDASTQTTAASGFGFKNRIINGAMVIFQRGVAANTDLYYSVDRWRLGKSNDATESVTQSTDAPPGFTHSIRNTVGTADTSIGAGQYSNFKHAIEAINIADFCFGTAAAKPVTLSFWVKSSVVGLYSGNICNYDETRICPYTYTINAANTWEYKTITFPGDTSGTWATAAGVGGLSLYFYMALGSNYYNGTPGVWGAPLNYGAGGASHANVLATTGNIFAITGVQLEKSPTVTAFDYRDYARELQMCQRYYCKSMRQSVVPSTSISGGTDGVSGGVHTYGSGVAYISTWIAFPTCMRTIPTLTFYPTSTSSGSIGQWNIYNGTWTVSSSLSGEVITENGFRPNIGGSWSANQMVLFYGGYTASCEL